MTTVLVALLLVLFPAFGWAQTVMRCDQQTNFLCATAGAEDALGTYRYTQGSPFVFEGATDDTVETTLVVTDPMTTDKTFTIPDADSVAIQPFSCSSTDKVRAVSAAGVITCAADTDSGAAHALLSATHTDTAAAAVARGAVIVGNATPAWARVTVGAAGTFLGSDGTDTTFTAISASHLGAGDAANIFVWNETAGGTWPNKTLSLSPRTADTANLFNNGIKLTRVTSCGGVNEYTLSGTTVTMCESTDPVTGNVILATYER